MSFSGDPVESATKGAVKGTLEFTAEQIPGLIKKFLDKKLAFVEDPEAIEIIKKQREKSEWHYFKKYVKDSDLHILYQTGLTLREYEKEGKDHEPLLRKIFKKYGKRGLHVAWFAQNGLFSKYIGNILEVVSSPKELQTEVEDLFHNIDSKVMFISQKDRSRTKQKAGEIVAKIYSDSPNTFIISSVGGAISVCEKVKKMVMQKISSSYVCELYASEGKRIYFLNQIPEIE